MPSFCDATTAWFSRERRLRNEHKNFKVITYHYPDLGSASNWLKQISLAARPIRSTTQICLVTGHQYGISAFVFQTSFGGKPVVASPNVGRFLRLQFKLFLSRFLSSSFVKIIKDFVVCVIPRNFTTTNVNEFEYNLVRNCKEKRLRLQTPGKPRENV